MYFIYNTINYSWIPWNNKIHKAHSCSILYICRSKAILCQFRITRQCFIKMWRDQVYMHVSEDMSVGGNKGRSLLQSCPICIQNKSVEKTKIKISIVRKVRIEKSAGEWNNVYWFFLFCPSSFFFSPSTAAGWMYCRYIHTHIDEWFLLYFFTH